MKNLELIDPTIFVIFGGGGDLTWRKLIPALYNLWIEKHIQTEFAIVLVDRVEMNIEKLQDHLLEGINQFSRNGKADPALWNQYKEHIVYLKGDFKSQETYKNLKNTCENYEKEWKVKANTLFYLATPPSLFGEIPKQLKDAGLNSDTNRARLVIEKPLGYNLKSFLELNKELTSCFDEKQIFRIDHYLGKETVQNILAFRFANPFFEPLWNNHYIDCVAITVAEKVGVENRGDYYDHAGALRDMIQNHLMQLLCVVAMEPMSSFDADEIRDKKLDVLKAIKPIPCEAVNHYAVRGQYAKGWIEGEQVLGYREEQGVDPKSQTETFVALKLMVENWRWQGVPFYFRTGKRLAKHISEITIQFRQVPHEAFPQEDNTDWLPARLVLSIQPEEEIIVRFQAKYPGPHMFLKNVGMKFNYHDAFRVESPDAYETLLFDVLRNDPTLFMRADQLEAAWKIIMPVLNAWDMTPATEFPNYEAGTWGPQESNQLLAKDGYSWPLPIE